jgi:cytochrome c peroxidase
MRIGIPFLLSVSCAAVISCETPEPQLAGELYLDLPEVPYSYSPFSDSNVVTLGRVLFYDQQLSLNNTISCASCHKQNLAFADNVAHSRGFENKVTPRNSMPIQNLLPTIFAQPFPGGGSGINFVGSLFWDGREKFLNEMVMRPIANHIEMGVTDADALAQKLSALPYYEPLFQKAYGSPFVTKEGINQALHSFVIEIKSENTRLDQSNRGEVALNDLERKGQTLFFTKYDCNSCHGVESTHGYLFNGSDNGPFANVGLDEQYADDGLSGVTGKAADAGKFKIPSLRNVALTGPYMHDGRFNSLEEVIDHYSETIANHPNLDSRLRGPNGAPLQMNISSSEKTAIIAFLHTLTDEEMISDIRLSDPFKLRIE